VYTPADATDDEAQETAATGDMPELDTQAIS